MELLNDTLVKQFKHNLAETFKEEINVKIKDFKKTFKDLKYIITILNNLTIIFFWERNIIILNI